MYAFISIFSCFFFHGVGVGKFIYLKLIYSNLQDFDVSMFLGGYVQSHFGVASKFQVQTISYYGVTRKEDKGELCPFTLHINMIITAAIRKCVVGEQP